MLGACPIQLSSDQLLVAYASKWPFDIMYIYVILDI